MNIVLFKLSRENLRQEPRKTEEPAPRQLLKPLHRGRRLRMLEFKPIKHFPDTWGFCLDGPEKQPFPINAVSPFPRCPGGLVIPSPSSLCSFWGRTQVTVSTMPSALIHRGPAGDGQRGELKCYECTGSEQTG